MPDLQTFSPEAAYQTKGNIVPQKAFYVNRALSGTADSVSGNADAAAGQPPTAQSVFRDHLGSRVLPVAATTPGAVIATPAVDSGA